MAGYFIAEEGALTGLQLRFEEGNEWILGRDPDVVTHILEDSMVSRKHAICRLTPEGYVFENLSSVNPATQNGKVITEPVLLREGDIIQIGNTYFRFTEIEPKEESSTSEEESTLSDISLEKREGGKWLLKVIAGPNSGAEFSMEKGKTYIIGKDPATCDIIFYDLSVSRQHAKITVTDNEEVFIEDMQSRNGVIINGELITEKRQIQSQDLVALGTTSFLVIDQEQVRETIYAPPALIHREADAAITPHVEEVRIPKTMKNWKEMVIPYRHLVIAGCVIVGLVSVFAASISLLKSERVEIQPKDFEKKIKEAFAKYPDIQFSYNEASGKLFLVGHVLTPIEKMEMEYTIKSLPFIESVEDNVVVDEYVWQSMNSLLMNNSTWTGVSVHSPAPGRYVLSGYLQSLEQAQALADYVNINFPYLDRLENQVIVESDLASQVQSILIEKGYPNVAFQLVNGEIVLSGRVDSKQSSSFQKMVNQIKALRGVRLVKNFVITVTGETSRIDLSTQYQVGGYTSQDDKKVFVVINGKILGEGSYLDGMLITGIEQNMVLLEKDGLKFKINYNLQ